MMSDDLGAQERAVLSAVSASPFEGQQEIARSLGLARSTVAAHIVQLTRKGYILGRAYVLPERQRVACVGGATVDRKCVGLAPIRFGTSNPVEGSRTFGGVARNVAENLARLGVEVSLATRVGDDESGRSLIRHLQGLRIDASRITLSGTRMTAEYTAILGPDSELVLGIADMGVFDEMSVADLDRWWPHLASAAWVFADCNLSAALLAALLERRRGARFRLAIDAVSVPKATRLPADLRGVDLLVLNEFEAEALLSARTGEPDLDTGEIASRLHGFGAAHVVVTRGGLGAVVVADGRITTLPVAPAQPVDVTGAGDAMIAGMLYRLLAGDDMLDAARAGGRLAARTTETVATVLPEIAPEMLES